MPLRTEQADKWLLILESHWWWMHARVYAGDRILLKSYMTWVNCRRDSQNLAVEPGRSQIVLGKPSASGGM